MILYQQAEVILTFMELQQSRICSSAGLFETTTKKTQHICVSSVMTFLRGMLHQFTKKVNKLVEQKIQTQQATKVRAAVITTPVE